jgi:hypothetical protein
MSLIAPSAAVRISIVPQPDGVHVVTTEEELRAVERLRYDCYVPRMHGARESVDHRRRLMPLPADERSTILYAVVDGEVVGTVRIRHGRIGPYTPEEQAGFAPEMFEPVVHVEDTMLQDPFVIRDEHLGGPVRMQLFLACAQYAISEGVDLVFCACLAHLVRTYRRIGFRTYKAITTFPEGIRVPMVAVVHDLDYLESIDAPLRVALESGGVELDRRRGRAIAAMLATDLTWR